MKFQSLPEAAAYWAEYTPDKVCLIEAASGDSRTYSEFWNQSLLFSKRLREMGIKKDERAVVRVTQRIDTLVAAFGIYMAGGIYVPIAQKIGDQRIDELIRYFDASFFIAENKAGCGCKYIDMGTVCEDGTYEGEIVFPDPDDVSDIFFTTGTTGSPKGVMRSFGGYIAVAEQWKVMEFTSDDVFMACNAQNLVGGISFLHRSFLIGATSIIGTGVVFLRDFYESINKYGVTVLSLLPAELSILLNAEDEFKQYCQRIRSINLKSAAVSVRDQKKLVGLLPNTHIFNNYNATEALSVCMYEISKYDITPLCVGKPARGVELGIMDADGNLMNNSSYENPGQIVCKTPTIMKGYWNNPELTASIMRDGWLVLADMGYMDIDGFVYLMGRKDDVINSGGHKIAPGEIEEITLEIDAVVECACVPMPDVALGSVPKLFVVMRKDVEFSAKEIIAHLKQKLEAYKLPRIIESIDVLPRTKYTIKVNKKELIK